MEDPKPVNEEEIITTMQVTLTPAGGGTPVILKFFDPDGEHGDGIPVVTASGPLAANSAYAGSISLLNETETPAGDISAEVADEANAHLFCFDVTGNVTISYADTDATGLPLGLSTSWVTGNAGQAQVVVTLRHQPGTKTGECPGSGDTDAEVMFPLSIE
ncbi:MAG TPA: hypothetical protein VF490_15075 [Chryseosolibacter sp.]